MVAACGATGTAAQAANTVDPSYTVYADDLGTSGLVVTAVSVDLHGVGEPLLDTADTQLAPAAGDDGGGAVCTMYLTRPHGTPQSPRDGDIYVEGEAHAECASSRVSVQFATAIEWRLDYGVHGEDGSSGTHYNQGPSANCGSGSRCPSSGDLVAPWGHVTSCFETGTYHATTVILSGAYTYRGKTYDLGGQRSATISGTYGRRC
jgi:hypothetical protein